MSGYQVDKANVEFKRNKEFKSNLLECHSSGCGACCFTYFLPCYTYAKVEKSLDASSSLLTNFCCMYWLECFTCCFVMNQREKIQKRQGIPSNCCSNCLVSYCCSCCALIQHSTEMDSFLDS